MKREKIAFDLDDTLCNVTKSFLKFNEEKYLIQIDYKSITNPSSVASDLKISSEEEDRRWLEFFSSRPYFKIKPSKKIVSQMKDLALKYDLYILTARDVEFRESAIQWINEHFPRVFKEILFIKEADKIYKKGEMCRDKNISLLVEDNSKHIQSCVDNHVAVIVFDRPWNRGMFRGIPRIDSLAKINRLIENMLNDTEN